MPVDWGKKVLTAVDLPVMISVGDEVRPLLTKSKFDDVFDGRLFGEERFDVWGKIPPAFQSIPFYICHVACQVRKVGSVHVQLLCRIG